jgi:hypothetical protein
VPAGPQILLQQPGLPRAAVVEQRLRDLPGGGLGQRDQQRADVLAPAGQVHRADGLAGDRVADRHRGAGEVLQVLGVMLVPEYVHRLADLQRGADAVGADEVLAAGMTAEQITAEYPTVTAEGVRAAAAYGAALACEELLPLPQQR